VTVIETQGHAHEYGLRPSLNECQLIVVFSDSGSLVSMETIDS
jgi:hypothetical protein